MVVRIEMNVAGRPAGKLADAELHFEDQDGPLSGLKLVGFAIWQRRGGTDRRVTFPARRYSLSGEQRSYTLLRPISDRRVQTSTQDRVRELILQAFEESERKAA